MMKIGSKEFKALQKEWYGKLADEGFDDIEYGSDSPRVYPLRIVNAFYRYTNYRLGIEVGGDFEKMSANFLAHTEDCKLSADELAEAVSRLLLIPEASFDYYMLQLLANDVKSNAEIADILDTNAGLVNKKKLTPKACREFFQHLAKQEHWLQNPTVCFDEYLQLYKEITI